MLKPNEVVVKWLTLFSLFPDNNHLENKWWHRLARVTIFAWNFVVTVIIVIIFASIAFNGILILKETYDLSRPGNAFKITDRLTGKSKKVTKQEMGSAIKYAFPESYKDLSSKELGEKAASILEGLDEAKANQLEERINFLVYTPSKKSGVFTDLAILPIFLVLLFVPTILYKTTLYVFTGSWTGQQKQLIKRR